MTSSTPSRGSGSPSTRCSGRSTRCSTRRRGGRPRRAFHGHHQLNRWPDGLEKCIGCELCAWACPADAIYVEGRDNTDDRALLPGRAVRARLPDQLPALHSVRAVHRGVPDPRADDDERVRAGRRQPGKPDLDQGAAAGAAAGRDGSPAAPDAARQRREGLLPARRGRHRRHLGAGPHVGGAATTGGADPGGQAAGQAAWVGGGESPLATPPQETGDSGAGGEDR